MFELEAYFEGRVQGVGFRATTHQIAKQMGLIGRVSNLLDGRVFLIAQGSKSQMEKLLSSIQVKFKQEITRVDHSIRSPTEEFFSFTIE